MSCTSTTAYLNSLIAARNALARELEEVVNSGPLLNYSLDGQSVDYNSYLSSLTDRISALNTLIQQANQPFWYTSRART